MSQKVMIVDDHALMRKLLMNTLGADKYQYVYAGDGFEAIERLKENPDIDLILLDVNMPNLNGIGFLEHVRANMPQHDGIPVLVVSTEGDPQLIKQAKTLKASGWLTKPFSDEQLRGMVATLLQKRAAAMAAPAATGT